MKLLFGTFCMMIFLCACVGAKTGSPVNQGLTGYIYQVSGNQMPGPGRVQSKGRGGSRAVFIYAPATPGQAVGASPLFSKINTRLIAKTTSDSTGRYAIKLAPGKYSVFIAEGNQLFAAESDGTGTLNPIEIQPNKLSKKDFTLNTNAVY